MPVILAGVGARAPRAETAIISQDRVLGSLVMTNGHGLCGLVFLLGLQMNTYLNMELTTQDKESLYFIRLQVSLRYFITIKTKILVILLMQVHGTILH